MSNNTRPLLKSARQHGQKMEAINQQQRNLLKPYFQSIIDTTMITDPTTTLLQVQELERDKIESTLPAF